MHDLQAELDDSDLERRSHRLQGLGLVLLVACAVPMMLTLEGWLTPSGTARSAYESSSGALGRIADTVSLLGLLAYVLFRQGRTLRQLGVTARWSDLAFGLGLAVLTLLPYAIHDLVTWGAPGPWLTSSPTLERVSLLRLLSLLAFAARCGLLLCAYVMTEVMALTGRAVLAIAASLALQEFFYASFTVSTAVSVLIGCLFYWKTRRATPVILGVVASGLWVLLHTTGAGS